MKAWQVIFNGDKSLTLKHWEKLNPTENDTDYETINTHDAETISEAPLYKDRWLDALDTIGDRNTDLIAIVKTWDTIVNGNPGAVYVNYQDSDWSLENPGPMYSDFDEMYHLVMKIKAKLNL